MAFSFDQIFAADPSNPQNVAGNASILIYAPGDGTKTPLTITDPSGSPLSNPVTVNANGFGSAFMHETLDRVAWDGGGFTGFFTSYEGMKQVAVAAQTAAEDAATTAGTEAAAVAEAAIAGATDEATAAANSAATAATNASASATAAANAAALVGAPADSAIAAAVNGSGTATKAALNATYLPGDFTGATDGQVATWDAAAGKFKPKPGGGGTSLIPNIVWEGDSLSRNGSANGFGPGVFGDTVPAFAIAGIDPRATTRTNAVVGKTVTTMLTEAPTTVDPFYSAGKDNIAVLWGGTNDFTLGDTPQQLYDKIKSWHDARRAVGFRTVAVTLTPRNDITPERFADLLTVNSMIRTNWATFANALADMNADARFGSVQTNADNATYYATDKLHFTLDGYAAAGSVIRQALASLGLKVAGRMGMSPGLLSNFTGTSSVAIGQYALSKNAAGTGNSAYGVNALMENTAGNSNTAVGTSALRSNTTATGNTAVGHQALDSASTGGANVAVGQRALYKVSTAANNVAVGLFAAQNTTTGASNVAIGALALAANTTNGNNVAIGPDALGGNTSANNTAVGAAAAKAATTATDITAVGYDALNRPGAFVGANATTTGARQVAVGTSTGQASATQRNDIVAVGYRALVDANDTVALGSGAQAMHAGSVALGKGSVTTQTNQVMAGGRDVEITDATKGIVLKSPNGTRYRVTVSDAGALVVTAA